MDIFNVFILFPKNVLSEEIADEDSYQKYLNQISAPQKKGIYGLSMKTITLKTNIMRII